MNHCAQVSFHRTLLLLEIIRYNLTTSKKSSNLEELGLKHAEMIMQLHIATNDSF